MVADGKCVMLLYLFNGSIDGVFWEKGKRWDNLWGIAEP